MASPKTAQTGRSRARARNAAVVKAAGDTGHVLDPHRAPRSVWRTDLVAPRLSFVVYGVPAGQGSKAPAGVRGGKPVMREQSDYVDPWRTAVREMAKEATREHAKSTATRWAAITEPVMVSAVVTVPATAAATKRGDVYAQGTPDLDKMQRAIGDALSPTPLAPSDGKGLTEAHRRKARDEMMERRRQHAVLHDDSLIVVWDHVTKVYPDSIAESLAYPGVVLRIWTMSDLNRAADRPSYTSGSGQVMTAADLRAWGRPMSRESWEQAADRLWGAPHRVLAAANNTVTLRGQGLTDDGCAAVLGTLATRGPQALLVIEDEPLER